MTSTWKTIRVFISSTFRDMHAERDWLIRRVFPELRDRLRHHQIHLVDIDLRWGITHEQAENNRVLPLLLDEIDRSRPYFIALLGERYGWIPEIYPQEVLDAHHWLNAASGKSVTELEILYGVLNSPKMHKHAFFYFRAPEALNGIPDSRLSVFKETDTGLADKLAQLKDRIRQSGLYTASYQAQWNAEAWDNIEQCPGRLAGLEDFGNKVRDQLWEAINRELQLPSVPESGNDGPLTLEQENELHNDFLETRLQAYHGRDDLHATLMSLISKGEKRPILVSGRPGSGKSSVLARVSQESQNSGYRVISHFVGASPASSDILQVLKRLCELLQRIIQIHDPIPFDLTELRHKFRKLIRKVPDSLRLLIILDSLDQLNTTDNAWDLSWLPTQLPPNVSMIVSCVEMPRKKQEDDEVPDCSDPKAVETQLAAYQEQKKLAWDEMDFERYEFIDAREERLMILSGKRRKSFDYEDLVTPISKRSISLSREDRMLERLRRMRLNEIPVGPWAVEEREKVIRIVPSISAKSLDSVQIAEL